MNENKCMDENEYTWKCNYAGMKLNPGIKLNAGIKWMYEWIWMHKLKWMQDMRNENDCSLNGNEGYESKCTIECTKQHVWIKYKYTNEQFRDTKGRND